MSNISAYMFFSQESSDKKVPSDLLKSQGFQVQRLFYACKRNRDQSGNPYGATQQAELLLSVKIQESGLKPFYERLSQKNVSSILILYNPAFVTSDAAEKDEKLQEGQISTYLSGTMFTGYEISVKEHFVPAASDKEQDRMWMDIVILLKSIEYLDNAGNVETDLFINY